VHRPRATLSPLNCLFVHHLAAQPESFGIIAWLLHCFCSLAACAENMAAARPCLIVAMSTQTLCPNNMHQVHVLKLYFGSNHTNMESKSAVMSIDAAQRSTFLQNPARKQCSNYIALLSCEWQGQQEQQREVEEVRLVITCLAISVLCLCPEFLCVLILYHPQGKPPGAQSFPQIYVHTSEIMCAYQRNLAHSCMCISAQSCPRKYVHISAISLACVSAYKRDHACMYTAAFTQNVCMLLPSTHASMYVAAFTRMCVCCCPHMHVCMLLPLLSSMHVSAFTHMYVCCCLLTLCYSQVASHPCMYPAAFTRTYVC